MHIIFYTLRPVLGNIFKTQTSYSVDMSTCNYYIITQGVIRKLLYWYYCNNTVTASGDSGQTFMQDNTFANPNSDRHKM